MNITKSQIGIGNVVNPFLNAIKAEQNVGVTENGAKSNASSLNSCVDFFAAAAAIRQQPANVVIELFNKAFAQNRDVALKILFYIRDVREGQGERKTFRIILQHLANNYPDIVAKNINNISFFGRWDDLYILADTKSEDIAFKTIALQLKTDAENVLTGKPVSLLAKWLKSVNTSSEESRRLGHKTAAYLGLSPKNYRKAIAFLRNHINVIETKLCAKKFSDIDYEKVPSKASLLYRKAFNKRDGDRYRAYLGSVEKGEAKMNASVVYPYEIIRPIETYTTSDETELKTLDLAWKNQPDWLKDNPHKGIVVADTSGSMSGMPILVSLSLAIYFAERNTGPFKDHFITFSSTPVLQYIPGTTIFEKVRNLNRTGWGMNTNLKSVFNLILLTAVKHKIKPEDMVDYIYIISDMQFDSCCDNSSTNFELIKQNYAVLGYKMPKLVFWNVKATPGDSPVTINDTGTALVSGCSPSILKSILSAKQFNPADVMLETINNARYACVSA